MRTDTTCTVYAFSRTVQSGLPNVAASRPSTFYAGKITCSVYVSVIHVKMTMPDLQRFPSNLNLIKRVEDIVVCNMLMQKNCTSHFSTENTK